MTLHVADFGVKCQNCGIKFLSRQIPIILDSGSRNSELRLKGEAQHFEPYAICTCPSCSHVDWATSFRRVDENCVLGQKKDPPHLQFRQAAINAERSGRSFFQIGEFYLYAAWCADDVGAMPQSREYRKLAIDCFSKALLDENVSTNKKSELQYLIGEMLRRSGEFTRAKEHFEEVIPSLPGRFAMMARRIIRLAEQNELAPIDFST